MSSSKPTVAPVPLILSIFDLYPSQSASYDALLVDFPKSICFHLIWLKNQLLSNNLPKVQHLLLDIKNQI